MMNKSERILYPGQIFRHFKGKLYQIVTIAKHSETGEKLVIYQQLYEPFEVYARPYEMFVSEVDRKKYPDVSQRYRFEAVNMDENVENGCVPAPKPEKLSKDKEDYVKEEDFRSKQSGMETGTSKNAEMTFLQKTEYRSEESEEVNPLLLRFLNTETYEEKRNVLLSIKGEITDRLIDDIAVSMDVAVDKGDLDERFASLLSCVDLMAKFEVDRLR